MWWIRLIKADVVEPVGRKANWSQKSCSHFEFMSAGYRKFETTIFSSSRDSKGVTEIGRKAAP